MTIRMVIVGVGALGSHLALFGRNWPVSVVAVDFDRVERKNVMAQFHTHMSVGRNKAVALQQSMMGLFGMRIEAVPHRLTADNARALLAGAGLVVDCVDNAATRELMQSVARECGIPCLHGALAADGAYARVMWDDMFTVDGGGEGQATCEDGVQLPFIAMVAARMAHAIQRFFEGEGRQSAHVRWDGVALL